VPTGQNQINIEADVATLVQGILDGFDKLTAGKPQEITSEEKAKIGFEIEKLIRAYDPCMSCASHFLKIDWEEK
jgi:coenzyme F420-reducing hydrogenase alpha subunit